MMRPLALLLAVGFLLHFAGAASAQGQLYGLSSSVPGTLYSMDTGTGAATSLLNLTGVTDISFTGLEILNGVLYATDADVAGVRRFGTINPTTGAFTVINSQGGSTDWHGLAADPAANLLYSVDLAGSGFPLVSITPGGAITNIGMTSLNVRGLAFDPDNNRLYAVANSITDVELYVLNTATGVGTLIGSTGLPMSPYLGLAYDNVNDALYLNVGDGSPSAHFLFQVDVGSGAAGIIGFNGATAGEGVDGLAFGTFAAVPEPTTVGLLGLVAAAGAGGWWKRRQTRLAEMPLEAETGAEAEAEPANTRCGLPDGP